MKIYYYFFLNIEPSGDIHIKGFQLAVTLRVYKSMHINYKTGQQQPTNKHRTQFGLILFTPLVCHTHVFHPTLKQVKVT